MNKINNFENFKELYNKKSWKDVIVKINTSIGEAIKILDSSALQILMVTDVENKLVGTITDGDIRRAILQNFKFDNPIFDIMNKNPIVVSDKIAKSEALDLMRLNKLRQLPIITENAKIIGLHVWDEIIAPTNLQNTCVIMAGGFGKRLHPLTENYPKPLIKVAGKPMIERILDQAKNSGFKNFIMALNFRADLIKEFFGDGKKFGVNIEYIEEEKPLGTAGALSLINKKINLPVFVINGDVLADVNYGDILNFHNYYNASATMVVHSHEWQYPFGVVQLNGIDFLSIEEKPILKRNVNSGIYVLDPKIFKFLEKGAYCDMPNLLKKIKANKNRVVAFPMHEDWLDLGRHNDLDKANKKLNKVNFKND